MLQPGVNLCQSFTYIAVHRLQPVVNLCQSFTYIAVHRLQPGIPRLHRLPHHVHSVHSCYPAPRMRSKGSYIDTAKKFEIQLLSEVHFNTGRLIFEFNGLQYHFVAQQVFVAFANPARVLFG